MKKLLNILGAIVIVSSTSMTATSCHTKPKKDDKTQLSSLQQNMLDGAEFMTKLILSSRHENMNFNVNELLTMLLTPDDSAMYLPTSFIENGVKNTVIADGLNQYQAILAPALASLNKNNYNGTYASYIMGMYSDDYYNTFLNKNYFEDTMDKDGNMGFNKTGKEKNAMGYAAGLNSNINLDTDDEDRERLAWGIQDNGPLTNYLLNLGVDGGYPGDVSASGSPCSAPSTGGTNGGGYMYYNSLMASSYSFFNGSMGANTKGKNSVNNKINSSSNISIEDQSALAPHVNAFFAWLAGTTSWTNAILNDGNNNTKTPFGEVGANFVRVASNLNIKGHVSKYASMFSSIDDSAAGASILSTFLNEFTPIIDGGPTSQQSIISKFIKDAFNAIWQKNGKGFKKGILDTLNGLDSTIEWEKLYGDVKWSDKTIVNQYTDAESMEKAGKFYQQILDLYNKQDDAGKLDFAKKAFSDSEGGFIAKGYEDTIIGNVKKEDWDSVVMQNNGQGGADLITALSNGMLSLSKHFDTIENIQNIDKEEWGGKSYYDLTASQKNKFMNLLGFSGGKITEGSLLWDGYQNLKVGPGNKEMSELFDKFLSVINDDVAKLWDDEFQYMLDDKYWKDSDITVATSNYEQDGTMEFTLDYTGVGDSTSNADQQYNKVDKEKLDNFNPYQTIESYQDNDLQDGAKSLLDNDRTSGEVLGKDLVSDLKAYDGTGMLENMKPVHHKYVVKWENVSNDAETPYWVISSIHSYNENDNNKEFFNIY